MRSELRSSLVIVALDGNATPSIGVVTGQVVGVVVAERIKRCQRLQADAEVVNEGSKVRDERRSTGSHKYKDGWLDVEVVGDEPDPGPQITALPNRGRRDPCLK
jgi:hypothetical protein